jgi:hypothetical protein
VLRSQLSLHFSRDAKGYSWTVKLYPLALRSDGKSRSTVQGSAGLMVH